MVDVVQLVEHQVVILAVAGSSPVIHPDEAPSAIRGRGFFVAVMQHAVHQSDPDDTTRGPGSKIPGTRWTSVWVMAAVAAARYPQHRRSTHAPAGLRAWEKVSAAYEVAVPATLETSDEALRRFMVREPVTQSVAAFALVGASQAEVGEERVQ